MKHQQVCDGLSNMLSAGVTLTAALRHLHSGPSKFDARSIFQPDSNSLTDYFSKRKKPLDMYATLCHF
jgi:hypothetical protein